ncbi:UPF0415 protein C7orf25-like [Glycine soja]|uniref:UPF0415 protein C7orf25-like n=1 Tax=Glycine soja TaxID=3848 RepID=A0A445GHX5_GLYSO|nr:UPF0415 protein C7orf25-like [Glycine soja]
MGEEQRVAQVELAKQRCKCVIDAINSLPCSTNITVSCRRTLLKLARAELAFLSYPSSSSVPLRSLLFKFVTLDEAETQAQPTEENIRTNLGVIFCSILMGMKLSSMENKACESSNPGNLLGETDLVNFDTTALIALVSGISNGGTEKLLATPESGMRQRFKGNYDVVIGQITSEIQNPIHMEFDRILRGKTGLICESVLMEFKELVSMCGGPNEKLRADSSLLNQVSLLMLFFVVLTMPKVLFATFCTDKLEYHHRVVPDTPSERLMGLPSTRKLALKNKVVFGTGDHWHAPTLTANMAFVRAVSQTRFYYRT